PWPHPRRDVKYEELTLEEFVVGYGQILQSADLSEVKSSARLQAPCVANVLRSNI
ncbi:hypothetical protein OS493_040555, partial [Desmophyllum pertusum]